MALTFAMTTPLQADSGYRLDKSKSCGGFPQVSVGTEQENCVGLVASEADGLIRPRRIVQLDDGDFIITDMVRWGKDKGIVWRLSPNKEQKLTKVFTQVDHAHGLAIGPDNLVYVGTRATIFRFDPNSPQSTRELVISDLPGDGKHPMSHFIFDESGNLIVNVGAPSDQCEDENDSSKFIFPCKETQDEALLRKYIRQADGSYPSFQVIARGLRNSMALAIHPESRELFQGENNMDFEELERPEEEINLIKQGAHYGWPYCYGNAELNPNYVTHKRRIRCERTTSPVALLPAHSAPLDMLFYSGAMFPELEGKLIVSLHGYRETGHRLISLDFNDGLLPIQASKTEIINEWTALEGIRPKGAPVGMTVAHDGSIWFVEDKNKTVMVLTKGEASKVDPGSRPDKVHLSEDQKEEIKNIQSTIFNRCTSCHGNLRESDPVQLTQELVDSGWIIPGNGESLIVKRISGTSAGRRMPLSGRPLTGDEIQQVKKFILSL